MGTRLCLLAVYTGEQEAERRERERERRGKMISISNGMFLVKEKREEQKKGKM